MAKPGKKGAAPKTDKKKFDGDTGSKETIKDSSRTKEKKSSPAPVKKSTMNIHREKTPVRDKSPAAREKTPLKKVTPISSKRGA